MVVTGGLAKFILLNVLEIHEPPVKVPTISLRACEHLRAYRVRALNLQKPTATPQASKEVESRYGWLEPYLKYIGTFYSLAP